MEVFMHDVPRNLTDGSLRAQLEPFMEALAIKDYHCDKSKKKPFAHVTFLNRHEGEQFLREHGQEQLSADWPGRRPRTKANLFLLGNAVFCVASNRQGEGEPDGHPNPMTLRGLMYAAEERDNQSNGPQKEDRKRPVTFELVSFSCGHSAFLDDRLTFVSEVDWNTRGTMKFTRRSLTVKLCNKMDIRIAVSSIVELIWSTKGLLTLVLHTTPSFFKEESSEDELVSLFAGLDLRDTTRSRKCYLDGRHAKVVGQCLVHQFKVSTQDLFQKMTHLIRQETLVIASHDLVVEQSHSSRLGNLGVQMETLKSELETFDKDRLLPFGILFQLQALASNAYLHPGTVLSLAKELRRALVADKTAGRRPISVDAMKMLFEKIDYPLPNGEPHRLEVDYLMELLRHNQDGLHSGYLMPLANNLARINRIMVTPTRITLHGPEMEAQNRILRKFPKHHDHFIRVQFCEEDGTDLRFNPRVDIEAVYSRFRNVLEQEITIAGRKYTFLGFSHSSLRAHSAWFSCPFLDDNNKRQTYSTIISELGNFSGIRTPARCAARIGQAFSETPFAVPLEENEILLNKIPDLTTADGSRVFSDGIGTISWDAMVTSWGYLSQSKNSPTCFQVRLGGAKGMVALDSRLSGSMVQIRDSMIKFPTEDTKNLEICDVGSKPISLVLNRQLVKILEDLGVPDEWFFKLQNEELARLRSITANATNTADFLKAQRIGDSFGLHTLIRYCDAVGIEYRGEDFLRSVVEATVLRALRMLKHKARIPVKKGITLFGVIDETGYLQEGDVFVTYDTMAGRYHPPPGPGRVLVSRSPALHPGDVQPAHNVIPPDGHPLRAHFNCVVFNAKGTRDLPSQLSGGDLDGDIYHVIWDPEARPTTSCQPADYPRVQPLDIGRPVTKNDMAAFFVDFMKADQLGTIATRHKILADQKEGGSMDPDCLTLAGMHSTAVDFSKTGIPVNMKMLPRCSKFRPDFMAPGPQAHLVDRSEIELEMFKLPEIDDDDDDSGPRYQYYKSEKLLGHLYRAVDERKIWAEDIHIKLSTGGPSFWDEFLLHITERCNKLGCSGWKERMEEARRIRSAYEGAVFSAMGDYSEHPTQPLTELEVFTGSLINGTGVQTHRQHDKSTKLRDEFERIGSWITDQIRMRGIPLTGYMTETNAIELCLACTYVGREEQGLMHSRRDDYGNLRSFSVVAATALLAELRLFDQGIKGRDYSTGKEGDCKRVDKALPN